MTKKQKPAEAGPVQVRPKHHDYEGVTVRLLASPGHGIPCDQDGCDKDAVYVMRTGMQMYGEKTTSKPGPNHVRCERHLNYADGAK